MPRKLPLCAWCGKKLRGARIIETYRELPGSPACGWHWASNTVEPPQENCFNADTEALRVAHRRGERTRYTIYRLLEVIEKRGPQRVVRNKLYPRK